MCVRTDFAALQVDMVSGPSSGFQGCTIDSHLEEADSTQGVSLTIQVESQGHMETVSLSPRAHGITILGRSVDPITHAYYTTKSLLHVAE